MRCSLYAKPIFMQISVGIIDFPARDEQHLAAIRIPWPVTAT